MVEVLSKAKIQSVKEIKKQARIKKRNKLLVKLAIVIVILIALAFLITTFVINNKSNYTDKSTGITFSSTDGFYVNDSFKILSKDQNMLLVFNISYVDSNQISKIINDITYLQSVFTYFQKNTTLVINIMDNKRTTVSCQSNLGDLNKSVTLNRDQCVNLLDSNRESFVIDFPNTSLNKSQVVSNVSEKLIYIKPKSFSDLDKSINLVLTMMFGDVSNLQKKFDSVSKNIKKPANSIKIFNDSNSPDNNSPQDLNQPVIDVNKPVSDNNSDLNLDVN